MTDTGRYLYAIARGVRGADLAGTSGMQGQVVRVLEHRGLAAIVSEVTLDEFGADGLRTNLEDLGWLEQVARTHDDVVHAASAAAPTAPLRLATICLDDDGVRSRLDAWHDRLEATLSRIEGRMEWSVKAFAPSADSTDSSSGSGSAAATGSSPGAAYLARRRAETTRRETDAQAAAQQADELHAALSRHAVASRRLAPQDRRLTGHEGTMTLNGAYLVDIDAADDFRAVVERLSAAQPGARIDVQGPWPPYSFATLDDVPATDSA